MTIMHNSPAINKQYRIVLLLLI